MSRVLADTGHDAAYVVGYWVAGPLLIGLAIWGAMRVWRRWRQQSQPRSRAYDAGVAVIVVIAIFALAWVGGGFRHSHPGSSKPQTTSLASDASPTPSVSAGQRAACESIRHVAVATRTGNFHAFLLSLHQMEAAFAVSGDQTMEAGSTQAIKAERHRDRKALQAVIDRVTHYCNYEL